MIEERIITVAITSGEKHDGKQLKSLIEKSKAVGFNIENIIGDVAYSEKENIEYVNENEINLIASLANQYLMVIRDKQKQNSNITKMQICMYVKLDI